MSSEMDFEVSQSAGSDTHSYVPHKNKSKKHVQFNSNVLSHHFLTIYRNNQDPTCETITEKLKSEAEQQMKNKRLRNAHMELLTTKFQRCALDD